MAVTMIIMVVVAFVGVFGGMMVLFTAMLSASNARTRRLQELKEGRPQITTQSSTRRKKAKVPDPAPL
ncbi:MAG: hypothetical protein KKI08_21290, partial [Armatimonadetes bacterium]|nr:hypothetical protein [Armatimonadota bacterium]